MDVKSDKKTSEESLKESIEKMRASISHGNSPNFKKFWEAKKECLILFKANLQPYIRFQFWKDYLDLSKEAKKLKELLDQDANFAKEQIEKAIDNLEKDIERYDDILKNMPKIQFPKTNVLKKEKYYFLQNEISLLNIFASRIISLRKEILNIKDIRVRVKSKFFKKLSGLGDKIFPKKKNFIQNISDLFKNDVEEFLKDNDSLKKLPFYILKSEIKSLQSCAKILTLNTKIFTYSRLALSDLWDKIKSYENKGKKEHFDELNQNVKTFSENCKKCSFTEAQKEKSKILNIIKKKPLPKKEVDLLKKEIEDAITPLLEKEEVLKKEKKEALEKRRKEIENLKEEIGKTIEEEQKYDADKLLKKKNSIIKKIEKFSLGKIEKQIFERLLKPIKDLIVHKKEKALLDLSKDQLQALDKMKKILSDRRERRAEIKKHIEKYRKALGVSGLDFQTAMDNRKMIDLEKERLEKIDKSIEEIEKKISEIEV